MHRDLRLFLVRELRPSSRCGPETTPISRPLACIPLPAYLAVKGQAPAVRISVKLWIKTKPSISLIDGQRGPPSRRARRRV